MKTVTRRELNHSLAQILDEVLATGEAVEVTTRGGRPLVIAPKAEAVYERWVREGLTPDAESDVAVLDAVQPLMSSEVSTEELLEAVRGERG